MKNKVMTLMIATFLIFSAFGVLAINPSAYNGLNKGKVTHLYLYEKDSSWNVVDHGAWGKLSFKDNFVFNGHGLDSGDSYTLIRYTDPWNGYPISCLGSDVADNGGNVHISGDFVDGGSKVWLVLSEDVNCDTGMTAWNPSEYLFEYSTI